MLVKRSAAVALMAAIGYEEVAPSKPLNWLEGKLKKLKTLVGDNVPEMSAANKELFDEISAAEEIKVVADDGETTETAPKKSGKAGKAGKGAAAEGKGKAGKDKSGKAGKAASTRQSSKERNKYGSIVGSSNAKVDAILGKKALTHQQIAQKAGLTHKQVRYKHLGELVKAGFAQKTDEGWVMVK